MRLLKKSSLQVALCDKYWLYVINIPGLARSCSSFRDSLPCHLRYMYCIFLFKKKHLLVQQLQLVQGQLVVCGKVPLHPPNRRPVQGPCVCVYIYIILAKSVLYRIFVLNTWSLAALAEHWSSFYFYLFIFSHLESSRSRSAAEFMWCPWKLCSSNCQKRKEKK